MSRYLGMGCFVLASSTRGSVASPSTAFLQQTICTCRQKKALDAKSMLNYHGVDRRLNRNPLVT